MDTSQYDIALEKARKIYDCITTESATRAHLAEIFPELNDDEDEVTRKALLKHMTVYVKANAVKSINNVSAQKILEWIEHQKKQ